MTVGIVCFLRKFTSREDNDNVTLPSRLRDSPTIVFARHVFDQTARYARGLLPRVKWRE